MPEKSFTDIDLNRLEEEWVEQPARFRKYADKLADAEKDLAEAKARLEVSEAEVMRSIRRNPDKYNVVKGARGAITEGAVKEAMVLTKKYQSATNDVIEAKHRVEILRGAVESLQHRKRALESLVQLHGQNYFSTPREHGQSTMDMAGKKAKRPKALKR